MTPAPRPQPPRGGRSIALVDWTASAARRVARLVRPTVAAAAPASVARHARHRTPTLGIAMLHRGQMIARRAANRRAASFRPEARLVLRRRIVPQIDPEPRFSIQQRLPAAVVETAETPRAPAAIEAVEPAAPLPPRPPVTSAAAPRELTRPATPSLIVRAARTVGRLFRGDRGDASGGGGSASPSGEPPAVEDAADAGPRGDESAPAAETAPPPVETDTPVAESEPVSDRSVDPALPAGAPSEIDLVTRRNPASAPIDVPEARPPDAPVAREPERDPEPPEARPASEAPSPARSDATPEPVASPAAPPVESIRPAAATPAAPTPPAPRARPTPVRPSLVTRIARRIRLAGADEPPPAAPAAAPAPAASPMPIMRAVEPGEPPHLEERTEPPAPARSALAPTPEATIESFAPPAPAPAVAREQPARPQPAPLSLVRRVARRVGLGRGTPEAATAPSKPARAPETPDAVPAPRAPVSASASPVARAPERDVVPPRTVLREAAPRGTARREQPAAPPGSTRAPVPPAVPIDRAGTTETLTRPAALPSLGVLSVVPPPRPVVSVAPSIARIYRRRPVARIAAAPQPSSDPGSFDAATLARAIDAGSAPAEVMAAAERTAGGSAPSSAEGYAIARAIGGPVAFRGPQRAVRIGEVLSEVTPEVERESESPVDLEELARKVFARLRARLLIERERHGLAYRWR